MQFWNQSQKNKQTIISQKGCLNLELQGQTIIPYFFSLADWKSNCQSVSFFGSKIINFRQYARDELHWEFWQEINYKKRSYLIYEPVSFFELISHSDNRILVLAGCPRTSSSITICQEQVRQECHTRQIVILHYNEQKYTSSCRAGNNYEFNHSF